MNFRERIENNIIIFFLATLLTGFIAGIGSYEAILNIAHLKIISETEYRQLKKKLVTQLPSVEPKIIYKDNKSNTNNHGIKFLQLSARSIHNPPKVNDRIFVDFTIQNANNKSIHLLETYVTTYSPSGEEKSFSFDNKNLILKPHEIAETSGSVIVDVPGIWEMGPHYALGKKWNGEKYPGHWKRFQISVE
jgi:hypothetical protein